MNENLTRRDWIAGVGGLVAVSSLPAFGQDEKREAKDAESAGALFARRGGYERLSVSYARIEAGATRPFSVLHISDTHLTAAYPHESAKKQELKRIRTETFGGQQENALRDSLAWAKKNVDYVLHTGDLIDWQSEANFDLVRKYFGKDMTGSLGNHEYSPDMWLSDPPIKNDEAFKAPLRAKVQAAFPFDISLQSQVVNGVNFVTLDDVFGTVTAAQVDRFAAEVKKGLPIVLGMHVPFYTPAAWRFTARYWNNRDKRVTSDEVPPPSGDCLRQQEDKVTREFIAYLKREPLLKGLLVGHEHIDFEDRFSPTAVQYAVGGNFMFHGREVLFV